MSKSLVLGAVAGAVIVALAGGYYFGVKTAKGQTPNVIAKVVNDGNAVSQQYFDGSWLIKSEKDESADSFSGVISCVDCSVLPAPASEASSVSSLEIPA